MATIRDRKNEDGTVRWFVAVRLKGLPARHKTFARESEARAWGRRTEVELERLLNDGRAEPLKHNVNEMIQRYKRDVLIHQGAAYSSQRLTYLEWWKKKLGTKVLAYLQPSDIATCRDELARTKSIYGSFYKAGSVNHYLVAFSHVCGYAYREWGWLTDNPVSKVRKMKLPRGRARFLNDDERARLLAACKASQSKLLYPIVVVALSTGMRSGEITSLAWKNVDLQRGRVILERTKNGDARSVPITGHALELLTKMHESRDPAETLVFGAQRGDGRGIKPFVLQKVWKRAVAAAELENFRFHDLRHTAASYLALNGATLLDISEVLGHKTIQMTKRYAHLSQSRVHEVVASMNQNIFKTAGV